LCFPLRPPPINKVLSYLMTLTIFRPDTKFSTKKTYTICFIHWSNTVCFLPSSAGKVEEDAVVDSKILPYCSIDKKEKKSLGELEQDFLQALQVYIIISSHYHMFCFEQCLNQSILLFIILNRHSTMRERQLCQMRNLIISKKNSCGKEAAL
jgi:hypothetical protein